MARRWLSAAPASAQDKRPAIRLAHPDVGIGGTPVNGLFANELADITLLGDLSSITGRSSGLETRMLVAVALNHICSAFLHHGQRHAPRG